MALAQLVDLIFEATDKNLISTITAIDQSAVFDTLTLQFTTQETG